MVQHAAFNGGKRHRTIDQRNDIVCRDAKILAQKVRQRPCIVDSTAQRWDAAFGVIFGDTDEQSKEGRTVCHHCAFLEVAAALLRLPGDALRRS